MTDEPKIAGLGFRAYQVFASSTGRRVLFAASQHLVRIHDLISQTWSPVIKTSFDAGGLRLALSDKLDGVVAGTYQVHGIAFYRCCDGQELWRRRDIKKTQRISLSRDGGVAYCGLAISSLQAIELGSGQTVRRFRGVDRIFESAYDPVQFVGALRPAVLDDDGARRFYVERTTFAILDAAFAPGLLFLSEAGGPVRCIDLNTGREMWRYKPPSGSHVLRVAYCDSESMILGIEWSYENGGSKRLVRLRAEDGSSRGIIEVGVSIDVCFVMQGKILITTEGDMIDTVTGQRRVMIAQ